MPGEAILVADVGTASTAVALVIDGTGRLLRNPSDGNDSWPTSITLEGDEYLIGSAADRDSYQGLNHGSFFQLVGALGGAEPGSQLITGRQLLTEFIRAMRTRAESIAGRPITRMLLAVPDDATPVRPTADPPAKPRRIRRYARPQPAVE